MTGEVVGQHEEYRHHGDEDASLDARSVETGSHAMRKHSAHITYILHPSTQLRAEAFLVGLDMSKEVELTALDTRRRLRPIRKANNIFKNTCCACA